MLMSLSFFECKLNEFIASTMITLPFTVLSQKPIVYGTIGGASEFTLIVSSLPFYKNHPISIHHRRDVLHFLSGDQTQSITKIKKAK